MSDFLILKVHFLYQKKEENDLISEDNVSISLNLNKYVFQHKV